MSAFTLNDITRIVRNGRHQRHGGRVSTRRSDGPARWRRAGKGASASADAKLLIGRDTRESGVWIERELAYGARVAGATVQSIGIAPTPAVAYLTGSHDFDAGVVISASHNPYQDNGIKVFSGAGVKYGGQFEDAHRERWSPMRRGRWRRDRRDGVPHADAPAKISRSRARRCCQRPSALGRVRIAVDCANGAMTAVAPELFRELGFELTTLGVEPDGRNINKGVGSTHPETLAEIVQQGGYRLGVAFDGDGDRAILDRRRRPRARRRSRHADVRQADEGRGPPARERRRRNGHEQHRARDRAHASSTSN